LRAAGSNPAGRTNKEDEMILTEVTYQNACLLSNDHQDIIVFEPCSGCCFKFDDYEWIWCAGRMEKSEILKEQGIFGMDHYIYIWIHSVSRD
jgi:hypothetical protein